MFFSRVNLEDVLTICSSRLFPMTGKMKLTPLIMAQQDLPLEFPSFISENYSQLK